MIIIYNFIILCKYVIYNIFRFKNIELKFEQQYDEQNDEEYCNCNLCYTVRNILLFLFCHLKLNDQNKKS